MLLNRLWSSARCRQRLPLFFCSIAAVVLTALPSWAASPTLMQLPGLGGGSGGSDAYTLGWVGLDGYDIFQVAAPQTTLGQRTQYIIFIKNPTGFPMMATVKG
jgi:hypothetical protein